MSGSSLHTSTSGRELSRLLSAAVVNQNFCNLLLSDPALAMATGYNGETFHLGQEDHDLVLSIEAQNLADFAQQILNERSGMARRWTTPVLAVY